MQHSVSVHLFNDEKANQKRNAKKPLKNYLSKNNTFHETVKNIFLFNRVVPINLADGKHISKEYFMSQPNFTRPATVFVVGRVIMQCCLLTTSPFV